MIVSHLHKFIYVRTRKTASSSLIHSLIPHLGPKDIVHGGPDDEWASINWTYGHELAHWSLNAAAARGAITGDMVNDYTVWTVERNPWDKFRSVWRWHNNIKPLPWGCYPSIVTLHDNPRIAGCDWELYSTGDHLWLNTMVDYEDKANINAFVTDLIGEPFEITHHHKNINHGEDYTKFYTPETKEFVAKLYHNEIKTFGYKFGEQL